MQCLKGWGEEETRSGPGHQAGQSSGWEWKGEGGRVGCIGEGVGSSEEASGLQQIRMFVCSSLPSLVGLLPLFGGVIAG